MRIADCIVQNGYTFPEDRPALAPPGPAPRLHWTGLPKSKHVEAHFGLPFSSKIHRICGSS